MELLLIILKGVIVLGVNIGFGYILSECIHFYLFHPRKIVVCNKIDLRFTPGLVFRKKRQFINYLHKLLIDYFDYAKRDYFQVNFLTEYENKLYDELFPLITKYINKDWIPEFISKKLDSVLSDLTWMLIYKLSRTLIPRLLKDLQVEKKIDLLDTKLDVYKLRDYFDEYFYKYFLQFNLAFFAFVGVMNMVVFWILYVA